MGKVENALKAARETKALRVGEGKLAEAGSLFREQFANRSAVVVADPTTWEVAGRAVHECLAAAGIAQQEPFIFTDKHLYAEYGYVDTLVAALKEHDAVPVAVGSGTINDLCKLASHLTRRPYVCVATAASMDGYTAFGASITAHGAKQTFSCPAPQACLADIDIIRRAPPQMTAAGYSDLFAKVTAGADWILADALGAEPVDQQAWDIVQNGLPEALSAPEKVRSGDPAAIAALTEALLLGGFAMQWSQSSRPASGAEHQFSHLWNMEHHTHHGQPISHGFQVAIGTLAITAMYEALLASPIDKLNIEACCAAWQDKEEQQRETEKMFAGADFAEVAVCETLAKYLTREELARQLATLKNNWREIQAKLSNQLIPLQEAKRRLQLVGAPTRPEEIGVTEQYLRDTFVRAQHIRRRFTVLDVAVRTGMMMEWVEKAVVAIH